MAAPRVTKKSGMDELAAKRAAVAMTGAASREAPKDGLGWGLELHRWVTPRDWPRALEERVPAEHRAAAETYLRGIAQRMRNLVGMARAAGYDDVETWKAAQKAARKGN